MMRSQICEQLDTAGRSPETSAASARDVDERGDGATVRRGEKGAQGEREHAAWTLAHWRC